MAGVLETTEKGLVIGGIVLLPAAGLGTTLAAMVIFGLMATLTSHALPGFGGSGDSTALTGDCAGVPAGYKTYLTEINAAAGRTKLPAALLAAQIEQESGFNPNAGSLVGAQGLMQLMPGTFGDLDQPTNREQFLKEYPTGKTTILDPQYNIFLGSRYLRQQYDYFQKREKRQYELALAAYNAGGGAVEDAGYTVPRFNDGEEETINYVKNILDVLYPKYQKCQEQIEAAATGTKIYLHWTAGSYDATSSHYTYNILKNGKVITTNGTSHTYARNSDSIGISVTAMAGGTTGCYTDLRGSGCPTPITQEQIDALVALAAKLAVENKIPIDAKHILSHGEAGSLMDYPEDLVKKVTATCPAAASPATDADCLAENGFSVPHTNYGPYRGGITERWEFYRHEDELRALIKTKAETLKSAGQGQ